MFVREDPQRRGAPAVEVGRRVKYFCAVLVVTLLAPLPQVHAGDSASLTYRIEGDGRVAQGMPLRYRVTVTNNGDQYAAPDLIFHVEPAGDAAKGIPFAREGFFVEAGDTYVFEDGMIPSQWVPRTGAYRITATESGADINLSFEFDVTRSPVPVPRFENVTSSVGLDTAIADFGCGGWSAGAAWGDIDGDRDLDLFLPRIQDAPKLWVNRRGSFADEAAARGIIADGSRATSAVFADYDNDGDQDLYVGSIGPNRLYENDGRGTFRDVTALAGVGDEGATQSASWGDYDADGLIDLYVTNYARCDGSHYLYENDRLYHNEGGGRFTDQTALLHAEGSTSGAGFQASWFDYDGDNDVDLYLANDFVGTNPTPNFLWRNDGGDTERGWRFTNVSVDSGTAVSVNSMGIAVGDYDRDLDLDVALSNIRSALLFSNNGDGTFSERGTAARIDRWMQNATREVVTWGTVFADLNNDAWEDLYFAAGSLGRDDFQPNAVFTNGRDGTFLDHSSPSGADDVSTSRGVAVADYDRDGRIDLYVVNQAGRPHLFRNVTPRRGRHWVAVDLEGVKSNRDACGAKVVAALSDDVKLLRQVFCGGTSLGSGADTVVHFGLGAAEHIRRLVVRWPSGIRQVVRTPGIDRVLKVEEKVEEKV